MLKYKFCPQCANRLVKKDGRFFCERCQIKIYLNSKPCVTVLPIKDGKVLLATRGIEPFKGAADVIGGFLELGEDPIKGAKREAKEETGLEVKITGILSAYPDRYGKGGDFLIVINYLAKILGGKMKAQDDVKNLKWVRIEDITFEKVCFENVRRALKDLQRWYEAPPANASGIFSTRFVGAKSVDPLRQSFSEARAESASHSPRFNRGSAKAHKSNS